MYGFKLCEVQDALVRLRVVESERAFGTWLGRGPDYVRNHRRAGGASQVSPDTVATMRERLADLATHLRPSPRAAEVAALVEEIDQGERIAASMRR